MTGQRGSGRPHGPPELRRTESVRLMVRAGEYADLAVIADAWGVPVATVGWVMIHERLAELRSVAPNLGAVGVARTAASQALLSAGVELPE